MLKHTFPRKMSMAKSRVGRVTPLELMNDSRQDKTPDIWICGTENVSSIVINWGFLRI